MYMNSSTKGTKMNIDQIREFLTYPVPDEYTMKLTSRERKLINGLRVGYKNEIITNPYSKEKVELCPEAVSIYYLVIGCEKKLNLYQFSMNKKETDKLIKLFYAARDIFIKNWPNEYLLLLD